MKTSLGIIAPLVLVIALFFLQSGCKKEENITQVVSLTNPLQGTWQAKSIRLVDETAAPSGYSRPAWRTFLMNSGILTTFGTATLNCSERDFTVSASLSPTLASFFPSGLAGNASGRYIIILPQNYVEFELRTWSPQNLFSEPYDLWALADFSISGNELTINLYIPRYWWTDYPPYYQTWYEKYTTVWTKSQ
ncbi:MAG: hypothetical protein ACP5JH_10830 [Bacteroidota bacterium]